MITSMQAQFISIKEAADRYQKAEITIRRLVRSIVKESQKAERNFIFPSESEAAQLRKQKKPFSYGISVDLLNKVYSAASANQPSSEASGAPSSYMTLLAEQMKVKDEQIRALTQALDALTERQRETNILMKGLQERFLLPEAKTVEAESDDQSSPAKEKTRAKKSAAPKKRSSWWRW